MKVDGTPYRTIWLGQDGKTVQVIDQTLLPHDFVVRDLKNVADATNAISHMIVRGAPLIGAAAAYGMALAMAEDPSDAMLARAYTLLLESRPTAVNLRWALGRMAQRWRDVDRCPGPAEDVIGGVHRFTASGCAGGTIRCRGSGNQWHMRGGADAEPAWRHPAVACGPASTGSGRRPSRLRQVRNRSGSRT